MVPSTLFETGVCVCVCVVGGRVGSNSAVFSSPVFYPSPPRKSDFEGCAQAHFQRSGLVIALTKRGANFFLSALDKQYFITNLK